MPLTFGRVDLILAVVGVDPCDTSWVRVGPILDGFCSQGCRFVVVGSVARWLCGEAIEPNDLDIVADSSAGQRTPLVAALVELGATVAHRRRHVPITHTMVLPWDWGWQASTPFGEIDVITKFIDGTNFDDHERHATSVSLPTGNSVRCHPTRRQQ